ncbi:hypothetical protein I551_2685 [Mycobacterium ulcerans str. Harvey]|uniref:Uncharacterized protein n=1 Tax=Mycobacterium ulcerans str. Harvey TaxID=1299332 RepID=A0ABN0R1K2_MYCUL|nr:hypothetical protein I551_2685 [Mycobacterium ulcerans str. Harvey]
MIEAEAAFCQVCGTATAALARHPAPTMATPLSMWGQQPLPNQQP